MLSASESISPKSLRVHLIENENLLVTSDIGEEPMATPLCELCNKNERYHICTESNNQHLCLTCFNKLHFGINAPRTGKSMVYNKCIFCNIVFGTNAKDIDTFSCVDCGQDFESLKELEEQETEYQNLLRPDKAITTDKNR